MVAVKKMREAAMKKVLQVVGVLALVLGLAGATWAAVTMKTYRHIQGFSIQYPAGWEIREDLDFQGLKIPLILLEPQKGDKDLFRENVNVISEKLPRPYGVDEYEQASLENMKTGLKDFKAVNSGDVKIAGSSAKYLVYTHKTGAGEGLTKVIVFFYTRKTMAYTITCSSTEKDFKAHLDLFMAMGKSFKLIGS
jgi:hypothetical protein